MKVWVARNCNGELYIYLDKPQLDSQCYFYSLNVGMLLFPEVTFENSPQMVEIKLVSNCDGKTS